MALIHEFMLQEWEIWHQYTSFFLDRSIDIESAGSSLVSSGLVHCARVIGGKFFWADAEGTKQASPHIAIDSSGLGQLDLRTVPRMDALALEGLYQSTWFEASEAKILTPDLVSPASYVRGFVGLCRLQGEGFALDVYPLLKVYSTGVIQVTFRMIGPEDEDTTVEDFVRGPRDLARAKFTNVQIPASLLKVSALIELNCQNRTAFSRQLRKKLTSSIPSFIERHTETVDTGHFEFHLAPLFSEGLTRGATKEGQVEFRETPRRGSGYSLNDLSEVIMGVAEHALASQKRSGRSCSQLRRGGFWQGKPNIYISKHTNQQESADENEEMHFRALGDIIAGVMSDSAGQAASFLPESSRSFQDFAWYVAPQAVLIVWAGSGLKMRERHKDANRGHLIYEQHAVSEILDYGYALHRRALELSAHTKTPSEAYKAQVELLELKRTLQHASRYGEIQQLLRDGWKGVGVDSVYEMVAESLRIREQESVEGQTTRITRWSQLVTTALGILATLGIADQVVKPVWSLLKWPVCENPNAESLVYIGVSLGFVLALLGILRIVMFFRK